MCNNKRAGGGERVWGLNNVKKSFDPLNIGKRVNTGDGFIILRVANKSWKPNKYIAGRLVNFSVQVKMFESKKIMDFCTNSKQSAENIRIL